MSRILFVFIFLLLRLASVAQEADSTNRTAPDTTAHKVPAIQDTLQPAEKSPDSLTTLNAIQDTLISAGDTTTSKTKPYSGFDLQYYYTIKDSTSTDTSSIQYFTLRNEWFAPTLPRQIDTTLRYFHYTNPIYQKGRMYQSLGNTGLATKNMIFTPKTDAGFEYGIEAFDIYAINEHTLKFYNTLSPYTKVYYKMAPDKEQILNFTHSQSVYRTVTLGMDIQIINSVGAYLNQKSQDRRIGLTGHYISDNKRYTAAAVYSHNKFDIRENGGLANEEVFENNEERDRLIYDINLPDANNLTKDATLFYKHSFELSPTKESSDSAGMIKKTPFNFGRLSHKIKYYRQSFQYKEDFKTDTVAALDYYANSYQDTLTSHDSTYYHVIQNTFSWQNSRLYRTQKSLGFDFGFTHKLINFQDSIKNFKYNQFILHGRLSKNLYDDLKIGGEAEYVQGDLNENDFRISGRIENTFDDKLFLKAYIDQISQDPDYFFQHYYSNHFRWDNNFKKENIIRIGGEAVWNDITVGGRYFLLTNYTYLNQNALPEQAGNSFSLLQAYIMPSFRFGNLNWDSWLYFQQPSTDQYMRVPFAAGKTAVSYRNSLFDNALYLQAGIDVMYKDLYYADQYMPALKSFYLQNRKKTGNFFYGDVYVSIKIKRTKLLLKYRHFNEGLTAYKYYDTPRYPMKDAGLEFSLSWRFHD